MGYGRKIDWRTAIGRASKWSKKSREMMACHWRKYHPALAKMIDQLHQELIYERVAAGEISVADMAWRRRKFKRDHPELAREIESLRIEMQPILARARNAHRQRERCRKHPGINRERLKRWKQNNSHRVTEYHHRRRLKVKPTEADPEIVAYFKHVKTCDSIACHICKKPIPRSERSIDHVVPLARGGKHELSNLAPAHRLCNASKSDKLLCELTA